METIIADIMREMRKDIEEGNVHLWADFGCEIARDYVARIEAALKHKADNIHRAMVIIAGIEMENSDDPPRLWTALEDAYDALSDALGTDGETTADVEEAKATGRHFVVKPFGNAAKMRAALENSNGLLEELALIGEWSESAREQIKENNAALSSPPRNCDRFDNADEAKKAIHGQYPLHIRPQDERDAVIDWLFAEAKGE